MPNIRVVLADDHAVVRKGIREFLEEGEGIEIVAEAGDGQKLKELILQFKPVVVAQHMPPDEIEDIPVLTARVPEILSGLWGYDQAVVFGADVARPSTAQGEFFTHDLFDGV